MQELGSDSEGGDSLGALLGTKERVSLRDRLAMPGMRPDNARTQTAPAATIAALATSAEEQVGPGCLC